MIDVDFNFQAEVGEDKDPDAYSRTLQEYHRILWSKPLPNGEFFKLEKISNCRLLFKSKSGDLTLSSDRPVATFSKWKRMQYLISQFPPKKIKSYVDLTNTIGATIIWPSNQINRLHTINAERGLNQLIADRFDLTIECIRRYYLGETSPLFETFKRYNSFFELFVDLKGFIDFFLLQDYVSSDYKTVRIASPFDDFKSSPVPKNKKEYNRYIEPTIKLIKARRKRIKEYAK